MADLDLFVLGGGSGGVACARRAAHYGAKVALAEGSRVGGTCVIRGCVPKKLMHYGAHFAEAFAAARAYGWSLEAPQLRFEALCEARNKEITRLNGIYLSMLEKSGVALYPTWARLGGKEGDAFIVEVGDERVRAKRVLVAVGAKPSLPAFPGSDLAITSDAILEDVYPQPARLAVIGGGYIGVEIASIFQALGTETTVVIRGEELLRGFDGDLRRELTAELVAHGLKVKAKTVPETLERRADCLRLQTSSGAIEADMVLMATGRRPKPNTKGLGLEALGVDMDEDGSIRVTAGYEASVKGVYAVGDCSDHAGHGLDANQHDLTPVAIAEGRAIAETLFNDHPLQVNYASIPTAIFSLPQASSVGLSEERARALGHDIKVFRTKFRPMLHTLTGAADRITMKLVVDAATDRVLGCHMVGSEAAEIIQGFAVALTMGATKAQFDRTVALHPSAAEEFVTMWQPVQA